MHVQRRFVIALFLIVTGCLTGAAHAWQLTPTRLRCEYLADPIGVDEAHPRLSWIVESDSRGASQSAYRILVASSPELLAQDEGDLWDTGRVESGRMAHIAYAGEPLHSRDVCFWKVITWDEAGTRGPWSEVASWEMGLLHDRDWSASWIDAEPTTLPIEIVSATYGTPDGSVGVDVTQAVRTLAEQGEPISATNDALGGDPAFGVRKQLTVTAKVDGLSVTKVGNEGRTAEFNNTRYPYLRRTFNIEKPIARARLSTTALGVADTFINGQRIGEARLAPGWTDYRERVHYLTFDVTDHLRVGENAIGAMVAPGWFAGRTGLFHIRAFYGAAPAYLAQLDITYDDGTTAQVVSDDRWVRSDGPVVAADIMDGETHDARLAFEDWAKPSFDDSDWSRATLRDEDRHLEAQPDLPVRVLEELPALSITEPEPGTYVFDLGQNMVGVARLRVRAERGDVITLRYAEMLNDDGTLYTENLRGAAATDTYICAGRAEETWTPRFTFHGFRYVEVTGLRTKPDLGTITGVVLGSELPTIGTFACSDERINQLQSNIVWGLRGNYLSIPTDCPQRDERMGWTGDAQAFIPTATYNANVAPFMTKWMLDMQDAQREDGAHSDVAPVTRGLNFGTPAWADAGVIVPWTIYEMFGDTRILERHIDSMTAWVEWCRDNSTGLIRDHNRGNDYGDWLSIEADTDKELIGTAYFARSADLLARSYEALGRSDEAEKYRKLFTEIRRAFVERYIDEAGQIKSDTQTAYVIALAFGLVQGEQKEQAAHHLIDDLRARGWRLSTGFIGVGHLLPVLEQIGRADAAYRLLMQDEFPSWLFSVKHGATTIWERWNGWTPEDGMNDPGMNSFNHYALGSCGQWLFAGVAGIRPIEPGFTRVEIAPHIGGSLTWAEATYDSMQGTIRSRWELDGEALRVHVTIPANTTARVRLPVGRGALVTESGEPVDQIQGIERIERQGKTLVVEIGSGTYVFDVHPFEVGSEAELK